MILVPKKFRQTLAAIIKSATGAGYETEIYLDDFTITIDGEMVNIRFEDAGDVLEQFDNILITKV